MKQLLCVILLGCFSLSTSAQDLMDKLAQAGCDCITQKDTEKMSQEQLQVELGSCLMAAIGNYQEDFTKEFSDLDFTNQADMQKFGEKIGMNMAVKCPKVFMQMAGESPSQANATEAAPKAGSISGTIKDISGDEIATVVVTDENGRSHKLLWLNFFKGSDQLQDVAKAKGRKVKVMYEEMEVYSPKAKEYYPRKKISSIEFQ